MQIYQGKSVFSGIAIGKIRVYKKNERQVKRVKVENPAAGTELADAFSSDTCNTLHVAYFTLRQKRFTTRRAVFPHATWLVQSADH